MEKDYLRINSFRDLSNPRDRIIYRLFETLPGFLSWSVLILVILFSWLRPVWVAIFIIVFVIFWLLRTIYLSVHLRIGYDLMKKHEKVNWRNRLDKLNPGDFHLPVRQWSDVYHLVILPMYMEPVEIIRETLSALYASDYPKERIIVVLACEEKALQLVGASANLMEQEFGDKFFKFFITWHPVNLPREIPGKGSNEAWSSREVFQKIIKPLGIPLENIIFSSFDIDTAIFPQYFSLLTYQYLIAENPTRCSFQPIPLFINNIWSASSFSRMFSFSSTFWQIMNQERPEKLITFSSHSMSFKALVDVGFKQTNVVSDDSRIFWQCFLFYNGNYIAKPLYYPIAMDANTAKSFWQTLKNLYLQQRRWAYGAADIPYFLFGFLKNKKIPAAKKWGLSFELIEGHWSWATAPFLIFLLGWLPLFLGGESFSQTLLGYNLPRLVSRILTISMVGLISSAYFSIRMLPPRPPQYKNWHYVFLAAEWFLFPIVMIFFTAIPALDAQTRLMLGRYIGFWPTPKTRENRS